MRNKSAISTPQSTALAYQPNSCRNCWNLPKGAADDELAPRYHGIYVSVPVYLVELNGKTTQICYRAQCVECGDVNIYNGCSAYKLKDGRVDFAVEYWPEIRRNGLDPEAFKEAVLTSKSRYLVAADLPKYESKNHRAEFYEPKNERCELYV